MARSALELGGHCRTGLEDNIRLDRDTLAPSNAALVRARRANSAAEAGRPVADRAQARRILGLPAARSPKHEEGSPPCRPMPNSSQRDTAAHPPALTPIYKTSVFRAPHRPLLSLQNSLSEVTGPVFGQDELGPLDDDLVLNYAHDGGAPIGERIIVHGRVLDGSARPVPGVLVEFWQANAAGRYRHRNDIFRRAGRPEFRRLRPHLTDAEGRLRLPHREARPLPLPQPRQ